MRTDWVPGLDGKTAKLNLQLFDEPMCLRGYQHNRDRNKAPAEPSCLGPAPYVWGPKTCSI